jgi:hypothetical protein
MTVRNQIWVFTTGDDAKTPSSGTRRGARIAKGIASRCVLTEIRLESLNADIFGEHLDAFRCRPLDAPFTAIEPDYSLLVIADPRTAPFAEMLEFQPEFIQNVIPIDPAHAELSWIGRSGLLGLDGETVHEPSHDRRRVFGLGFAGAVVGFNLP